MPTDQNAYNSRVTDEALEKRFRDTFTSQSGAELVSDLYASGVIVPTVDFTAAATGQTLAQNLQTAWDFSTASFFARNTTVTVANTSGFWQVDLNCTYNSNVGSGENARIYLSDGIATKQVWKSEAALSGTSGPALLMENKFVVFLRSGDSLVATTSNANISLDVWTRQIADVNGNLTDPLGFTSS